MTTPTRQLALGAGANASKFTLTDTELVVERAADSEHIHAPTLRMSDRSPEKWPKVRAPLRNVLWAEVNKDVFEVSLLANKKSKAPLSLLHVTGSVSDADREDAVAFTEAVMAGAYAGNVHSVISAFTSLICPALPTQRRLKVFVNPKSGPVSPSSLHSSPCVLNVHDRARLWAVTGRRLNQSSRLQGAKLTLLVRASLQGSCLLSHALRTVTTRGKQAQEIIEKLPLDAFDAVVVMSGDGLIHEVLNGYAAHAEPAKAFRIPITPIPAGSGNGLAINLLGIQVSPSMLHQTLSELKHPDRNQRTSQSLR